MSDKFTPGDSNGPIRTVWIFLRTERKPPKPASAGRSEVTGRLPLIHGANFDGSRRI